MVPLVATLPVTIKPDVVAAEPKNHTNEESTPKAKKTNNNLGGNELFYSNYFDDFRFIKIKLKLQMRHHRNQPIK